MSLLVPAALTLPSLSPTHLVLLVVISLIGGVGITAIGPGGILITMALFAFTDLSPAEVAGTAIVTHIGTGIVGSLAFLRSGQLVEPRTRRLALVLSLVAIVCTPLGVAVNARISGEVFGLLLAIFVVSVGASVMVRERLTARGAEDPAVRDHPLAQAALGGGVSVVSGLFGLGGPMISVPLMVVAGYPLLMALAAAQAQSIVVASAGTATYLVHGTISWPLVLLTGVPEMIGVWLGWKLAHTVPTRPLRYVMATSLIVLGPVMLVSR